MDEKSTLKDIRKVRKVSIGHEVIIRPGRRKDGAHKKKIAFKTVKTKIKWAKRFRHNLQEGQLVPS